MNWAEKKARECCKEIADHVGSDDGAYCAAFENEIVGKVAAALRFEREACAKIAERFGPTAYHVARAIRERDNV